MPKSAITGEEIPRNTVEKDKYYVPFYKRRRKDNPHPESASNALGDGTGDDTEGRERGEPRE
jgi:hypothetical protein